MFFPPHHIAHTLFTPSPSLLTTLPPIYTLPITPRLHFDVVVGIMFSYDSESYAGCSVATGRASHARQVKGDGPDRKGYPGPADLELGMRLTNPPHKNAR
jgi:hypothetical protein